MARKQTAVSDRVLSVGERCLLCWKRSGQDIGMFQAKRHEHFVTFRDSRELEAHLIGQYGEEKVKDGMIPAILHWYYEQKDLERKHSERQDNERPPERPMSRAGNSRGF